MSSRLRPSRNGHVAHPQPTARAAFLYDYLDLPEASGVEDARWEHFQWQHLCDDSVLRIENKSRQIAWSFLTAAEAVASALLEGRDSVFVSINQDEATEKIRYARYVYEALRVGGKPDIIRDSTQRLEFANGARLQSLPARPPRGRARSNVYLDEFAHAADAEEIYKGAMPIISKGGRVRIGSSPFGGDGKFWEVYTESMQPYPGFVRKRTPWWEIWAFCNDVPTAFREAPTMLTADAVARFGNERIRDIIFPNMVLEDFEQEYCGLFNDLSTSWITYDEIKGVQRKDLRHERAICRGKDISDALFAIVRLRAHFDRGRLEPTFALGMDIGRTHDATDIVLVGLPGTHEHYPMRLSITLQGVEFDDQAEVLDQICTTLPVTRGFIDRSGLGWQLAENANKRHPERIFGVDFSSGSKILWATEAKKIFQQGRLDIPIDKDLAYQLHAIKRINTGTVLRFDAERTKDGHADRAWGLFLALAAGKQVWFADEPAYKSQFHAYSTKNYA